MPQGPAELHEKWGDDSKAIEHLQSRGFHFARDGMIHQMTNHSNSEEDESAITYLMLEWDYGYMPADYANKHEIVQPNREQDPS